LLLLGRQAPGRGHADRFGPMLAGMVEIVHDSLSGVSLD
jgi:hypothetical protein